MEHSEIDIQMELALTRQELILFKEYKEGMLNLYEDLLKKHSDLLKAFEKQGDLIKKYENDVKKVDHEKLWNTMFPSKSSANSEPKILNQTTNNVIGTCSEKKKENKVRPYQIPMPRKQSERKKLPGLDCSDCKIYYDELNLPSAAAVQERKNLISRHRVPRAPSPPGLWNYKFDNGSDDSD